MPRKNARPAAKKARKRKLDRTNKPKRRDYAVPHSPDTGVALAMAAAGMGVPRRLLGKDRENGSND